MMPSSSTSINDKVTTNNDSKSSSISPSSSPRSSPRPSPQPESKEDHSKIDTTPNLELKETFKHESTPSSQDSSTSRLSTTSSPDPSPQGESKLSDLSNKDRKDLRPKKKSSWFNSLYPTYKSRSEDFKKLFDVPADERLVVDYYCALQKDILIQGHLYTTQNYLCFYANIFGWETNLTLKWKDVAAITKEKTALVIPNAVLICTKTEKYFFTSLMQRDKAYLMLFRIWQNALMDQPMTQQEMWTLVHQCYGSELGLTSDDEDYISPTQYEEKFSSVLSVVSFRDSFSEVESSQISESITSDQMVSDDKMDDLGRSNSRESSETKVIGGQTHIENSDSESDKPISMKTEPSTIECPASHEGRVLLNEIYPIHIDQLFTLLFTSSKFYIDFHASQKTSDLTQTPWTHNPLDNSKSRVVNLTMSLGQTMGPKTCQVTERHTMLPCSKSGSLYSVDVESVNAGIPYADSFYVTAHYCLKKVSETHTSIHVTGQLKFKKNVWGLVKGMIERNVWSGLEDFFGKLKDALQVECEENVPEQRKSRRKRRLHSMPKYSTEDLRLNVPRKKLAQTGSIFTTEVCTIIVFVVLLILLVLNVLLYYKLWYLEETSPAMKIMDLSSLKLPPKSHEEWIQLLQQQEYTRTIEAQKWQKTLTHVVSLLRKAEDALEELRRSIHPNYMDKVVDEVLEKKAGKAEL
ncbi:protein Aster-B-like [Anthonomus grandis grandis]|uniref:protein Aster-B-like n=1 Tax=Anthonomus grandis grandis TaxID=2921223 RepID=UPI0021659DEC|nr:protein Aster-B-like [Anthonomus grandis grandis]